MSDFPHDPDTPQTADCPSAHWSRWALFQRHHDRTRNQWSEWEEIHGRELWEKFGATLDEWKHHANRWIEMGGTYEIKIVQITERIEWSSHYENQGPTDLADSPSVGRTEGWVELQRVLDICDRIAAGADEMANLPEHHMVRLSTEDQYRNKAAEMRQLRGILAALPTAEPGPKSDSEGGERCSWCAGSGYVFCKEDLNHDLCPKCMAP